MDEPRRVDLLFVVKEGHFLGTGRNTEAEAPGSRKINREIFRRPSTVGKSYLLIEGHPHNATYREEREGFG